MNILHVVGKKQSIDKYMLQHNIFFSCLINQLNIAETKKKKKKKNSKKKQQLLKLLNKNKTKRNEFFMTNEYTVIYVIFEWETTFVAFCLFPWRKKPLLS